LAVKASEGVEVNVLRDAQDSAKISHEIIDRMRSAGATVVWFRPPRWYDVQKLDRRMHRRLLIVDGEVGLMSGSESLKSGMEMPKIPSTSGKPTSALLGRLSGIW
jgi:phosphatidylserine/phosphatidylglycerophosphate/cardiolipin synthase-like enzyme